MDEPRKTVGAIVQNLIELEPDKNTVMDQQSGMQEDYIKELIACAKRLSLAHPGKNFFVCVLTKSEKLLHNVFRNYFVARLSCPTPNYDPTVYMMPASDSTPSSSAMTHVVRRACRSCRRAPAASPGARAAHREIATHLGGVEHVQWPAAIEGDEIRDIDQRVDRTQSDRVSRFRNHSGDGLFFTPRTRRSAKAGQSDGVARIRSSPATGHGNSPLIVLMPMSLNFPMSAAARSRATPCTPVQSARFGVRSISMNGSSSPAHCA